jgi:pimeloyl-ACP methyl ester carboxylesterase
MDIATAHNGDVDIAYETFGSQGGEPLLLMGGLDAQMVWWPEGFCTALAAQGFHVARYDHRDSGLSTHFPPRTRESAWSALVRRRRSAPAYTGADMTADALAVLDALGWDSAHLCGASMGAALAQLTALRHPARVRSLTSMMSIPMSNNPAGLLRYLRFPGPLRFAFRRYGSGRDDQVRMLVDLARLIASPGFPFDEAWARETAEKAYDRRPPDRTAGQRQIAAGRAMKIPEPGLAGIRVPTLVIHGEDDRLIRTSGGRAVAARIPGARLVTYPGMGHSLPRELWPAVAGEIRTLANSR